MSDPKIFKLRLENAQATREARKKMTPEERHLAAAELTADALIEAKDALIDLRIAVQAIAHKIR